MVVVKATVMKDMMKGGSGVVNNFISAGQGGLGNTLGSTVGP